MPRNIRAKPHRRLRPRPPCWPHCRWSQRMRCRISTWPGRFAKWQVRHPIYSNAAESWRAYENFLDPLKAALSADW